jgi:cytochrome b561
MSSIARNRYPLSVAILHWLVAFAIIGNLAIGWMLDDNMDLMDLHRSIGVGILLLAVIRLVNKILQRKNLPASVNPAGSWHYRLEKIVHGILYVSMLGIPLLGWLKTNAAGHQASFFGLFDLPMLLEKNRRLSHLFGDLHSAWAYALALLIGLHVAGAALHWLTKPVNVFRRILPVKLSKDGAR